MTEFTVGSLFSGIGGLELGLERAGMIVKWQVEIDEFCQKVLTKHWPDVPKYKDVRNVGKENLETVDLICGGFPCQDVSLAGEKKGLAGKRSTLWSEFYRIVCEIQPGWVIIENVPGLYTSDDGRFFRKILWELFKGGYDAEWDIVSAAAIGAPHLRERVFIVAYPCGFAQPFGIFNRDGNQTEGWYHDPEKWYQDRNFLEMGTPIDRRVSTYKEGLYKPDIHLLVDGIPFVLDADRTGGNAVVPQVAEWIGKQIMEVVKEIE